MSSWAADSANQALRLQASTELSTEGYLVLSWDAAPAPASLILEQSQRADFSNSARRELGEARATTLTGLADGDYYFRLVGASGPLSEPVHVQVAHHSLTRAASFFFLGACLFGLLIVVIVSGNREASDST